MFFRFPWFSDSFPGNVRELLARFFGMRQDGRAGGGGGRKILMNTVLSLEFVVVFCDCLLF